MVLEGVVLQSVQANCTKFITVVSFLEKNHPAILFMICMSNIWMYLMMIIITIMIALSCVCPSGQPTFMVKIKLLDIVCKFFN